MTTAEIREPDCPGCGQPPGLAASPAQVFCTNDKCNVFCWNATRTRAENQRDVSYIDLSGAGGAGEGAPG